MSTPVGQRTPHRHRDRAGRATIMSGSLLSDARWRHLANNLPAGTILIAGRPDQARQNAILLRVARDLGGKGYRIATLTLPPPIY